VKGVGLWANSLAADEILHFERTAQDPPSAAVTNYPPRQKIIKLFSCQQAENLLI
jgi:hypothetical protein